MVAASAAKDRAQYLLRPDLGRKLADASLLTSKARQRFNVVFVVTEGLSARAVAHARPLLAEILPALPGDHWRVAPLIIVRLGRVAVGVAVAVADSRYLAEDALELIEVDYEPLPAVVDPERALAADAPLVHEALESNCAYERTFDFGDVERNFAEADAVVTDRLRWHRFEDAHVNRGRRVARCRNLGRAYRSEPDPERWHDPRRPESSHRPYSPRIHPAPRHALGAIGRPAQRALIHKV